MKFMANGVEGEWCYLYWWNWLSPELRYWGYERLYYDGPHSSLGLWFFNLSWRLPWTRFSVDDGGR